MLKLETMDLNINEDVLTVTIDRGGNGNAVNFQMIKEFNSLADWLRDQQDIKFVVFTNNGKFFSVGADLYELKENLQREEESSGVFRSMQIYSQEMVRKLENLEQVTIAALRGSAYGAGAVIPITTDFRFMTPTSVLNIPETNVGVFLTWGCTPRLVKAVGALKAKEIIMLCEDISAEECYRLGLINKIVPDGEMDHEVEQLINKIRNKGNYSIRMTKKLVNASVAANMGDLFISEPELVERVVSSGETKELVQRFIDRKRK